jgi:hypothetical protein
MIRPTRLGTAVVVQLAGFSAFALARGDRRLVAYLLMWGLLAAIVRFAHRRWPLPPATLGALAACGAVHLAGGLLPSPDAGAPILYETWIVEGVLKFDQVAHAGISAVVAVAAYQILGHLLDPRVATPNIRAVVALLACWGFGAANELFEFLSGLRFDDSYAGDLGNAGWDLAFNTAGSVAAVVACVVVASGRHERGGDAHVEGLVAEGGDAATRLHGVLHGAER